ncbi:divalent-cation tolerance protein CutA [Sphingobium sp. DEHP117]|uniref:divalent-cation tolerance protein CutA n=1 Tax=Sphingobium sp. DEHP117 TaxID=2993436 RepID=UPI0027D6695A|nr:divalent cation tolerance protein CutA [Sphingobium sp. DEHP117]MDQ4420470.1 divalent-cation tolerance protein CutA [Sphingobium sp. DEHP117]
MSGLALVYAVFADADSAAVAGRAVVKERLAACANILSGCLSIYEWEGTVQENEEVPALFKTTPELAPALIARIAELHAYAIPAILSWPVETAHEPFAQWVKTQTS